MTMRPLSLLALLLPLLAGCGGGPYKTAPVSGRVTVKGKPLANAAVLFQPVATAGNIEPGPGSTGTTDAEGRYTLSLVGKDSKGAVVGKHKVQVTMMAPDADPSDDRPQRVKRLPAGYSGKNTKLEYDVPAGGTDAANFELTGR
jgi:hypothetical protein